MSIQVNRVTGEVLPDYESFTHCELGSMLIKNDKPRFQRNILAHTPQDIKDFRSDKDNFGVFKTLLMSNEPEYLKNYNNPETLFLAPLTFDMDASKDPDPQSWQQLVKEVMLVINYVCFIFHIKDDKSVRLWFSGSRGFHIEFPYELLGIYAHHDLGKIFATLSRTITEEMNFKYLDMSLYGAKHLLRLDHSRHQKTGCYKWPMHSNEVLKAYDYNFLCNLAKTPRADFGPNFWATPQPNNRAFSKWDYLVDKTATKVHKEPTAYSTPDKYDMHSYRCIEMQFEDGYVVPTGTRYHVSYIVAQHLRQNGFDRDTVEAKLLDWANNHCQPPYNTEPDIAELHRMLNMVYNSDKYSIGCGYIQRNAPLICDWKNCPIGKNLPMKKLSLI